MKLLSWRYILLLQRERASLKNGFDNCFISGPEDPSPRSLLSKADDRVFRPADNAAIDQINQTYSPISDLDLAIQNGWGETPQYRLPKDWRTRRNPRQRESIPVMRNNEA